MKKTKLFLGLLIGALVLGFTACQHDGTQDVNVVNWYDGIQSGYFEGIVTYEYYSSTTSTTNNNNNNNNNNNYNNYNNTTNNNNNTSSNDSTSSSTTKTALGTFSYVIGNGTAKNSNFYTLKLTFNNDTFTIKKFGNVYSSDSSYSPLEVSGNVFTGNFTIKSIGIYKNLQFKAS